MTVCLIFDYDNLPMVSWSDIFLLLLLLICDVIQFEIIIFLYIFDNSNNHLLNRKEILQKCIQLYKYAFSFIIFDWYQRIYNVYSLSKFIVKFPFVKIQILPKGSICRRFCNFRKNLMPNLADTFHEITQLRSSPSIISCINLNFHHRFLRNP